jgi:PIN domain nuclease of toxin-antitoxin system
LNLLLDTHVLLWVAQGSKRLSTPARQLIEDRDNSLYFSPISLQEIIIKQGLNRPDFVVDAEALYRGLVAAGYVELTVTAKHCLALAQLPPKHKDPFDRLLIAQALIEGMCLLTADDQISQYPYDIVRI